METGRPGSPVGHLGLIMHGSKPVLAMIAAAIAIHGCAERTPLKPGDKADVRPVGTPVKYSLPPDSYIFIHSFGGRELVIVDPSLNYDPAHIEKLKESITPGLYTTIRYADYAWKGEVKNNGGGPAFNVYVKIKFAGGIIDSAYIHNDSTLAVLGPGRTAPYAIYTRGAKIDGPVSVIWQEEADTLETPG